MLYIKSFKNYEEFKQVFGMTTHGNGAKSRNNNILLALLKDRRFFRWWLRTYDACVRKRSTVRSVLDEVSYLSATNMDALKNFVKFMLHSMTVSYHLVDDSIPVQYGVKISFGEGFDWILFSLALRSDEMKGICTDGDSRTIRYVNTERGNRVFKMKAGKFITRCIEEHFCTSILPEQVKRWIGEEFAREWQSYASAHVAGGEYALHVDADFEKIYDKDSCKGDFNSCMAGKTLWTFYRDAVDASATYLTDKDGMVVARCVIYNDVRDASGNVYRLAERQYSTDGDDVLKQILVDRLIAGGYIDGYKRIGASCHDSHNFVSIDGTSMENTVFHIDCPLSTGDAYSYQDSFKYFCAYDGRAYNNCDFGTDAALDDTDGVFHLESDKWSEYNECWISEDDAVVDEIYDDWIYDNQACDCIYDGRHVNGNSERLSDDDDYCWSEHEDAYIHEDECACVGNDYYLKEDCVTDHYGDWCLADDCEYSGYHHDYICSEDAVWSNCCDSYILKDESTYCQYDKDWCPNDDVFFSDLTGDHYCSAESMAAAEADYRKCHALVPCDAA